MAVEVCGEFGLSAEPLSVTLNLFNAVMARQMEDGRTPRNQDGWWDAREFDHGAWGVAVDPTKPLSGPGWNGHLVALVKGDQSFIVDLSQGQFSRPEYSMSYGPALLELELGDAPPWSWQLPSGDRLIMRPCPSNDGWVRAPAWKLSAPGRRAVKQIINETRIELKHLEGQG